MADPFDAPLPTTGQKPWSLNPAIEEVRGRVGDVEDFIDGPGLEERLVATAAELNPEALSDEFIASQISSPGSATQEAVNAEVTPVIDTLAVARDEDRAYARFPIGADDTAGLTAYLQDLIDGKRDGYLRDNIYRVSNIALDYSGTPDVALGFVPPRLRGGSKRSTIIRQLGGSTGDLFTVKGKASTPSHTGKVTALDIGSFTLQGTSTGRDGLVLQSVTDVVFDDFWVQSCGRHGIALDRQTFSVGVADEYMYGIEIANGKSILNGGRGVACIGQHPIGPLLLSSVQLEANAQGGMLSYPSSTTLVEAYVGGNGGPGVEVDYAPGSLNAFAFRMIGGRLEGNSGYEIDLKGGHSHLLSGVVVLASTGAHGLRVGGGTGTANDAQIIGGFFAGDKTTVGQKAFIIGANATGTQVTSPRIETNEFKDYVSDISDVYTNSGTQSFIRHRGYSRSAYAAMVAAAGSDRTFESWQKGDTVRRWSVRGDGFTQWGGGNAAPDVEMLRDNVNRLSMGAGDSFRVDGVWNGGRYYLGTRQLWVDSSGNLRGKNGAPSSDTDGVIIAALP